MTDPIALDLRFRPRDVHRGAPDVDAFLRSSPPHTRDAIAVLPGPRKLVRDAPLVVFFQHGGFGIPRPHKGHRAPDLASWSVRPTAFGYLASVPASRFRSRAAWIIAACLPLAIPTPAAMAGPPTIQRPKKESAKPPPADPAPESDVEAEPDPEADPEADTPPTDDEDEPTSDLDALYPRDDGETDASPPPETKSSEAATLDAAWEGVDGFDVDLELKGGANMRGIVSAVQPDTFTLIQHDTGQVLVLSKSSVLSLRVHVPKPLPVKRGSGLIAGGSVLTSVGAPVFISGVVFLGVCPSCVSVHLPLLFIGGGALAGGIPMIVAGARRRHAYLEAVQEREVSPIVMRTRDGWTGGLRFRF